MRLPTWKNDFRTAAARDGMILERSREPWLNQHGHLGLPESLVEERRVLGFIFAALGGLPKQLAMRRPGQALLGDFRHRESGTLIEVDTWQHFNHYRLIALNMYPPKVHLGFDLNEYRSLCRQWAPRSDHYRPDSASIVFGDAGDALQRQRAYEDALRDLVTPAMGRPPVVRVPANDGDGEAAYKRVRDQLLELQTRQAAPPGAPAYGRPASGGWAPDGHLAAN